MNNSKEHALHSSFKALAFVCAGIIVIFSLWLLVRPKTEYSENENRYLQQWPEFSLAALANGVYLSEVDDYLADQFPLRDIFVTANTKLARILGKTEINGVYLAKDGYLIEEYKKPERTELISKAFNRLCENVSGSDVTLMLVPTAASIYSELLPYGASFPNQLDALNTIYDEFTGTTVDAFSALLDKKDEYQLFYRTDHHWTSFGAYCGYTALCSALELEPKPLEEYRAEIVSSDFKGTIYSKLSDYAVKGDEIAVFYDDSWDIDVYWEENLPPSDSPFEPSYLDAKDKYSMFLNNIHPLVTIVNNAAGSDAELAIVKDSYANCLVPFLIEHYAKIYVFDTRYYVGDMSEFINSHENISDVAIIYNINTMDSDTGATKIR